MEHPVMAYTETSHYDAIIRRQIDSGRASNKTEVIHQAPSNQAEEASFQMMTPNTEIGCKHEVTFKA